ncbi:hypothetical protein CDAR_517731 [Caerostris darwini]|uniref:Ribosomal protein S19 n=1 Tax=Caerostris darwini TaxID=1538125 RepID=A0AAV4S8D6_9ARAC|nr:hypothetical protein CDAR_517731 [Caerostris darwini]
MTQGKNWLSRGRRPYNWLRLLRFSLPTVDNSPCHSSAFIQLYNSPIIIQSTVGDIVKFSVAPPLTHELKRRRVETEKHIVGQFSRPPWY